jgi:hypothetical protein
MEQPTEVAVFMLQQAQSSFTWAATPPNIPRGGAKPKNRASSAIQKKVQHGN